MQAGLAECGGAKKRDREGGRVEGRLLVLEISGLFEERLDSLEGMPSFAMYMHE